MRPVKVASKSLYETRAVSVFSSFNARATGGSWLRCSLITLTVGFARLLVSRVSHGFLRDCLQQRLLAVCRSLQWVWHDCLAGNQNVLRCLPRTSLYFASPIGWSTSSFAFFHLFYFFCRFVVDSTKLVRNTATTWNNNVKVLLTGLILKTNTPVRIKSLVSDDNWCKLQNAPGRNHDQPLSRWWHFCRHSTNGNFPFLEKRCLQPLYFPRSPPSTHSCPFCADVQFSRDSNHAFNDQIIIKTIWENRGLSSNPENEDLGSL